MNTEIAFREKRMTHEIVYSFGAILFYWQSATKRKLRQEKMEKKKKINPMWIRIRDTEANSFLLISLMHFSVHYCRVFSSIFLLFFFYQLFFFVYCFSGAQHTHTRTRHTYGGIDTRERQDMYTVPSSMKNVRTLCERVRGFPFRPLFTSLVLTYVRKIK